MDFKVLEYTVTDQVCVMAMNRPEKHNALGFDLLDDLDAAFDAAEADDGVKVVVLKGNGPSFCSGYDVKGSYYIQGKREGMEWNVKNAFLTLRGIEARYKRIWDFPKPTIAQVHGNAIAGGCYLQMVCDISVAADNARLGHPAVKLGGVSSMPLWQVMLGPKKARYLLFTGRTVDGKEAERIGLVSLSVPLEELEETVMGIARDVKEIPDRGVFSHKEALNTSLEIMGIGAQFRYHGHLNALGRLDPDQLEILSNL
ncbi:enoyl-CoA hydratase-related protein [Thermodesulfobacteriota bacterium]